MKLFFGLPLSINPNIGNIGGQFDPLSSAPTLPPSLARRPVAYALWAEFPHMEVPNVSLGTLLRVRGSQRIVIPRLWTFLAMVCMPIYAFAFLHTRTYPPPTLTHAQSTVEEADYFAVVAALLDRKADPNARVRVGAAMSALQWSPCLVLPGRSMRDEGVRW